MACRHRIKFGGCSIVHFILLCTPQYEHTDSPSMCALRMEYEPTISVTLSVRKKKKKRTKQKNNMLLVLLSFVLFFRSTNFMCSVSVCISNAFECVTKCSFHRWDVRIIVCVHLMQNTEVAATMIFSYPNRFFLSYIDTHTHHSRQMFTDSAYELGAIAEQCLNGLPILAENH